MSIVSDTEVSLETMDHLSKMIHSELGILYERENYYQLENRLKILTEEFGFSSVSEFLNSDPNGLSQKAKTRLLDLSTNNETLFFRDETLFSALKPYIVDRLERFQTSHWNIWSAASSTGQETYSLAMLFENVKRDYPQISYDIFASDISQRVLDYAEKGLYSKIEMDRGLSSDMKTAFFDEDINSPGKFQIKRDLKSHISFEKKNLIESFAGLGPFDLVFCRNVLIYQTVDSKTDVVNRIFDVLKPNGSLVLGSAESMIGLSDRYVTEKIEDCYFYTRGSGKMRAS